MDESNDLVTNNQQTDIDVCNRPVKKIPKSKKKAHKVISLTISNDLSTVSEDNDADKLLEENNKLREQNLKLQKILAKAGVKFDNDNYACESLAHHSSSVTYTSASTTFISDIQDVKVSGGSCLFNASNRNASSSSNNDDDYNSSSNNNVECSSDAVSKNKNSKRLDEDQFAGSSSEVLLCDTSTNIDCPILQDDNNNSHTENDMFSELQVDTTEGVGCKSSDDMCLKISLPTQSCSADQNSTSSFNIKTSSNYLNSDSIVDISPPLPSSDQGHFSAASSSAFSSHPLTSSVINNNSMFTSNNSLNSNYNAFGQPWSNLPSLTGSNQSTMLNLQRFDGSGASQLNLMNNFNNGIFINQLGQPISFLPPPPPPQAPSLILNTNTGLLTPQGKILSPANNSIVAPQGNVLLQNCAGLGQPFTSSASALNYIPQATPLFNGNQMKTTHMPGQMTLNVLPQNSQSRDFLMLPNGKLVPISTQPSVLPTATNPAMQSILTGFPNQVRLQSSQLIGPTNIPRNSQPFGFLPNQFSILGSPINPNDISRLANPSQFAVNGLPLVAPSQMPPTLQVLNHLPQFSPQANLSSNLNPQPATLLQHQNFLMQNNQPCMMAYITPEGTIVLSLQQQGSKKTSDELQKTSQMLNNSLSQEKKTQRRIMPKPPTNEGLNLNTIIPKGTAMNCNLITASSASLSSSSNVSITADEHEKVSQPYFVSNQLLHETSKKSMAPLNVDQNASELINNNEDFNCKKKSNLKKRDPNNTEKKKRIKTTSKAEAIEPMVLERNVQSCNPVAPGADMSDLQDISCCILNDQMHEQFVHTLNEDDQGDINQFSDLIVMDNEVTSNPSLNNTSKDSIEKTNGLDLKDSLTVELACNSVAHSNNHTSHLTATCNQASLPATTCNHTSLPTTTCNQASHLTATCNQASNPTTTCHQASHSTTTCNHASLSTPTCNHSESIMVYPGEALGKNCGTNNIVSNNAVVINGVDGNKNHNSFTGNEKKKKKKMKHVNDGLLTLEQVTPLPNLLYSKSREMVGVTDNVHNDNSTNNFYSDSNNLAGETITTIEGSISRDNNLISMSNSIVGKRKDNNNNLNMTSNVDSTINVTSVNEISSNMAFDSDMSFHLNDSVAQIEASSTTSHVTGKHVPSNNFASEISSQVSAFEVKPLDGMYSGKLAIATQFTSIQPAKVEEGTQTMRHERRKKKKKAKRDKLCSVGDTCDVNEDNVDKKGIIDAVPPTLTKEPSVVDNIPDKFSFFEDQLMAVVEKVENLAAQSVSSPLCASSSSQTNINNIDLLLMKTSNNRSTAKFIFNGAPPKLELSVNAPPLKLENLNKRKHQESDAEIKFNKKIKHQHENFMENESKSCNYKKKSDNNIYMNCGRSEENKTSTNKKSETNQISKESLLVTNTINCQPLSNQRKNSTELTKCIQMTDNNSSIKANVNKESLKFSKSEEMSKPSARHIAIASLARTTNNKLPQTKTAANKINFKTSENPVEPQSKQSLIHLKDQSEHACQQGESSDDLTCGKNDVDENLDPLNIKNEPKSVCSSNPSCPDTKLLLVNNNLDVCVDSNIIDNLTLNVDCNTNKDTVKNKKDLYPANHSNDQTMMSSCSLAEVVQGTCNAFTANSQNNSVDSSNEQNMKKKDVTPNQTPPDLANMKTKPISLMNDDVNSTANQSDKNDKSFCNKESETTASAPVDKHQAAVTVSNLKSEVTAESVSKDNNISMVNNSNQQKIRSKTDSLQTPKSTKFQSTDTSSVTNNHTAVNNNANNNNNSHFYPMDDASKKFSYPNIFAPPLFSDPYSSSCAQFSTFPVNGGTSFDTGFMLPPCLPFDAPVASANFNYYGADTSRYSHFGHSSLSAKNPCHSFSSMPSDYPSCSMEPKKVSSNGNFVNNSNRMNKDDSFRNKIDLFKKDPFMPGDFQFDAQFMFPNADKSNMGYCMDNANYGLPFSSSTFLNNNISTKGYANTKLENQVTGKSNKTFTSPPSSSSSSFLTYNRTSTNTLASPPLHHHPLLFDQKTPSFDLPFNSSNLNSFMENCGMMDQTIVPSINGTFPHNSMKDYNMMKDALYDEKKTISRSANAHKSYNVSLTNNAKQTSSLTTSLPNVMVISSSTPANQTKTTTKTSKNSKKTAMTGQSKSNVDNNSNNNNNNNNACMFNQHITPIKANCNSDVLSNITSNFNSGLFCKTTTTTHSDKYHNQYSSTVAVSTAMNNTMHNNTNLRTCSNIGMDYVSSQILGPSTAHHHPHFGFNHLFPEMDLPNGYLKFTNPNMADVETMPLHHHHNHKNLHQSPGSNQTMLSDFNPFFHPSQYAFDGSSSYLNQSNCSTGPFSMSTFNIRMPRMHHQNNNSF